MSKVLPVVGDRAETSLWVPSPASRFPIQCPAQGAVEQAGREPREDAAIQGTVFDLHCTADFALLPALRF